MADDGRGVRYGGLLVARRHSTRSEVGHPIAIGISEGPEVLWRWDMVNLARFDGWSGERF